MILPISESKMKPKRFFVCLAIFFLLGSIFATIYIGQVHSDITSQNYVNNTYIDPTQVNILSGYPNETWVKSSAAGWIANDTTNYKSGTQGLKITSNNSTMAYSTNVDRILKLNLSGQTQSIWLYIDNVTNLGGLSLYLANSTNFNAYEVYEIAYRTGEPSLLQSGWNLIGMPMSNGSSSNINTWGWYGGWTNAMLSSVAGVQIKVWASYSGVNVSVTCSNWVGYNTLTPNGVVTFTFDDGTESTYNTARGIMDAYGYKGVSCIITNDATNSGPPSNYMTWAQIQMLVNDGWDAISHSVDHPNFVTGGLTTAQIIYELQASQRALEGNLTANKGYRFFAQPYWSYNSTIENLVSQYYDMASLGNAMYSSVPPANINNVMRYATTNVTTASTVDTMISNASAFGSWLVLTFHDITPGDISQNTYMANSTFAQIISYCNSTGIPVKTFSQVYDSFVASPQQLQPPKPTATPTPTQTPTTAPTATPTPTPTPTAAPKLTPTPISPLTTPISSPSKTPSFMLQFNGNMVTIIVALVITALILAILSIRRNEKKLSTGNERKKTRIN